mmetsp:Transcript_12571/g.36599  ORF Transcript_12571/g.36599 Transcript_12571/m.36599 type:complete len:224 (-) Transcript_12571:134-805(-)
MCRHVVERAAGRERNASRNPGLLRQLAVLVLQPSAHVGKFDARFDEGLSVRSDLTVDFGTQTNFGIQILLHSIAGAAFLGGLPVGLRFQLVLLDLAHGKLLAGEQRLDRNGWRLGLPVLDVVIREGSFLQPQCGWLQRWFLYCSRTAGASLLLLLLFALLFLLLLGGTIGSLLAVLLLVIVLVFLVVVGRRVLLAGVSGNGVLLGLLFFGCHYFLRRCEWLIV